MIKKGIILAGGTGTRMSPLTKAVNKQLLPIYDKPLFFYPLSVLMLSGIKNILIIVNKGQLNQFKKILPENNNLGLKIIYKEQPEYALIFSWHRAARCTHQRPIASLTVLLAEPLWILPVSAAMRWWSGLSCRRSSPRPTKCS